MKLTIQCPEMAVRNTGYFWELIADRLTDNLECRGAIDGMGLTITFPPCRVRYIRPGRWMVDAVVARGYLDSGEYIQIGFPEEPVVRQFDYKLTALKVPSIREHSFVVTADGRRYIESELPEADATPVGFGMRTYIVEAVTIEGEVE